MAAKRHHKSMGASFYDGYDATHRQERADGAMIHEDYSQTANLPQNVICKDYPQVMGYNSGSLDDTMRGVDAQMDRDNGMKRKHSKPHKY